MSAPDQVLRTDLVDASLPSCELGSGSPFFREETGAQKGEINLPKVSQPVGCEVGRPVHAGGMRGEGMVWFLGISVPGKI